jgi:glycosyltransferase involved in cell wall biosynthesis
MSVVAPAPDLSAPGPATAGAAGPRVLHVVLSLNPGGTERLVVALAERLGETTPTAVCCLDDIGAWGQSLRAGGVPVEALARAHGFRPALARHIARIARNHRADVIHCHHYSPFVYAALSQVFYRRARLLFTEHGRLADAPPSGKRRLANAVLARLPDAVFAVSADLKAHLVREGFRDHQIRVLHNGIDTGPIPGAEARAAARQSLGVRGDACIVATVARLDPVKDLGMLVKGFAGLHAAEPESRLVIMGEGPERQALETLVLQRGLSASVAFLGHRDDARRLLPGADVYVNSSTFEGISLTILEAMAACLPVVATRVGGNPEIIDSSCGVLVDAGDSEALARELTTLARASDRRTELGRRARQRVEDQFSLDRMVRAYSSVYRNA